MSQTEMALLSLKGAISEMPEENRARVHECAGKLRATIREYGDIGLIAEALVGIERLIEEEKDKL